MERFGGKQVSSDGAMLSVGLPLELGRESVTGPAGVGLGLLVADVNDRLRLVDRVHPVESVDLPTRFADVPIARRLPAVRADVVPAV